MCGKIFNANYAFSQSTVLPLISKEQDQIKIIALVKAQLFPIPKILYAIYVCAYIKNLL